MILIPPPLYGAAAALVMWLLHKYAPLYTTTASWPVTAGIIIALCGVCIELSAVLSFRRLKTTINPLRPANTTALVTTGIYSITRNPMYLGMAIILTGVVLMLRSLSPVIMPLVFCAVVTAMQIRPEEKILQQKFAADYTRYTDTVARWL